MLALMVASLAFATTALAQMSGMMQSAGALTFLDPTLSAMTALHDILELQFGAPPPTAPAGSAAPAPSRGPEGRG